MAEQENAQVNQAGTQNGEHAAGEERQEVVNQAGEIAAVYDRARRELNEAVQSLRAEIARLDLNQARTRVQTWVDENPTLAVFLGVGAGIVLGRLLSDALRPAPPPPAPVRAARRAQELAAQAKGFAGGIGAVIAQQAAVAARQAQKTGRSVSKQARTFGDDVARRAHAAGGALTERTGEWSELIGDTAQDVQKAMQKKVKQVRRKVRGRRSFGEAVMDAAGTAVAAVAIKRVNDWIKKLT